MHETSVSFWKTISTPWQEAVKEAWIAFCRGSLPIGAVIVEGENTILTRGRNALLDQDTPQMLKNHFMAHAEANAYIDFGYLIQREHFSRDRLHMCTLYTTLEPCTMCTGITIISDIRNIRFLLPDPFGGASELLNVLPNTKRHEIRFYGPESSTLGNIMMALLIIKQLRFGLKLPPDLAIQASGFWRGVQLGRQLGEEGTVDRLCAAQASVEEMINTLAALLA